MRTSKVLRHSGRNEIRPRILRSECYPGYADLMLMERLQSLNLSPYVFRSIVVLCAGVSLNLQKRGQCMVKSAFRRGRCAQCS